MLGTLIRTKRHPFTVKAIEWSPDGRYIASAGGQQVTIWAVANGNKMRTLFPETTVSSIAWSPDGTQIAIGSDNDRQVTIWEVASGLHRLTYTGHTTLTTHADSTTRIWKIAWLSDGIHVASKARELHVWDSVTGTTRWATTDLAVSFACSPDGRRIITHEMKWGPVQNPEQGDDALRLHLEWERQTLRDALTGKEMQVLSGGAWPFAWMPDGRQFIQRYWRRISIYDLSSATVSHWWDVPYEVEQAALSPDGHVLAAIGRLRQRDYRLFVSLWDTHSEQLIAQQQWPERLKQFAGERFLAWSPESNMLAIVAPDKTVQVWDLSGPTRPVGQ